MLLSRRTYTRNWLPLLAVIIVMALALTLPSAAHAYVLRDCTCERHDAVVIGCTSHTSMYYRYPSTSWSCLVTCEELNDTRSFVGIKRDIGEVLTFDYYIDAEGNIVHMDIVK